MRKSLLVVASILMSHEDTIKLLHYSVALSFNNLVVVNHILTSWVENLS